MSQHLKDERPEPSKHKSSLRNHLWAFALLPGGLVALSGCPNPKPYLDLTQAVIESEGKTVSQTPPSGVFPPDSEGKYFPLDVASSTKQSSGDKTFRTVELRGWLRAVDTQANCDDPDWHYDLELDPDWADQKGIDLNQVLKVGNLMEFGIMPTASDSLLKRAATPLLHIELNGWRASEHLGQQPPGDWGFGDVAGNCAGVTWPYNPHRPLAWQPELKTGQYVRMVGSIVTDNPHFSTARVPTWLCRNFGTYCDFDRDLARMNAAKQAWSSGRAEEDADNPVRWTEMHPPDIIVVLPDKPQRETLRGVALLSENCAVGTCASTSMSEDIFPPGPKPTPTAAIQVTESVGKETNFGTIVPGSGNAKNDGALITVLPDRVRVSISVRGQSLYGAPGKFKALYRVSWKQ